MFVATVKLTSASPYSQSKYIQEKKSRDETHDDFESRTWKQRCSVNDKGFVYIPPMAFKNALSEAAKYKPRQIPGKGKATYTKNIVSGVLVFEPLVLPVHIDDVQGEWYHVPSDGMRGGAKRVPKCFPVIHSWSGVVQYHIFDEEVTEEVFMEVLKDSGAFIGVGRFRPKNNGFYGRFTAELVSWVKS